MTLTNEIQSLIAMRKEGEFWDFKEVPHDNNAALLHDILCLANTNHAGNRYIIYGVSDPASGCKVIGLTNNQAGRKSQAGFVDFLRSKKFAGDIRPVIELHTIEVTGVELDVLTILDLPYKPYYLLQAYKDKIKEARAYHIYTRTNDSNTPIDSSADILFVEKMWRQRFGLDLAPLERMKLLLSEPQNWSKDVGNQKTLFHINFPEYTIKLSRPERFEEVFSYFFTNEKSFLGNAVFKYNSTKLFELEYMYCDEMRIVLSVPDTGYFSINGAEEWYYYYDLAKVNGQFLLFLSENDLNFNSRGSGAPFLIFNNESERKEFEEVAKLNWQKIHDLEPGFRGTYALKRIKQAKKSYMTDALFLDKIQQFHQKWASGSFAAGNQIGD